MIKWPLLGRFGQLQSFYEIMIMKPGVMEEFNISLHEYAASVWTCLNKIGSSHLFETT